MSISSMDIKISNPITLAERIAMANALLQMGIIGSAQQYFNLINYGLYKNLKRKIPHE